MTAFTYILRCSDNTLYVGSTDYPVETRVHQHNETDHGAAYTRRRRPVVLEWHVGSESITEAYALERRIHGWSHAKKQALIDGRFDLLPELARKEFHKPGRMDV